MNELPSLAQSGEKAKSVLKAKNARGVDTERRLELQEESKIEEGVRYRHENASERAYQRC